MAGRRTSDQETASAPGTCNDRAVSDTENVDFCNLPLRLGLLPGEIEALASVLGDELVALISKERRSR